MQNNKNKTWHLFLVLGLITFLPSFAHADCSSPAGIESEIVYNTAFLTMQYCDGTNWIAMNQPGSGSGGCSSPAGFDGEIVYNTSFNVMQACAGNQWMAMGPLGGVSADTFVQVSAGSWHSCGVKADGTLWCWGDGSQGKLGYGGTAEQDNPVQESSASTNWSMVSAGYHHTCAVKTDGTLWCWGYGNNGSLGYGGTANQKDPVQESSGSTNWSMVSAARHTCGVKADGTLWCWGYGNDSALGYGGTVDQPDPVQESSSSTNWSMVSAGNSHTCAVKTDGTLWCWGSAYRGELCDGQDTTDQPDPVQESSSSTNWSSVSAGNRYHSCGIKTDGSAWCCGHDSEGQLGNGAITGQQNSPSPVSDAGPWSMLDAGRDHTCGVKDDGTLWCWGMGSYGRLGNGSTTNQPSPVQITEAGPWSVGSAGDKHTCGVKTDNSTYCWGDDSDGQLGRGIPWIPQKVIDPGPWSTMTGAFSNHSCGMKQDGTAWCWGYGWEGQLGNGTSVGDTPSPIQVSDAGPWSMIDGGSQHSCGVKTDGTLWCWGMGGNGKLGYGGTANQKDPVQESTLSTSWSMASAGGNHTCAVKTDGTLWCWGDGSNGRLGYGGTAEQDNPVQESSASTNWNMFSAGYAHTCAVKTDGTLWCWGYGSGGRLGYGGTAEQDNPVQESSASTNWSMVSAGNAHTCAVKTDGTLWCWGDGSVGELGYGGTTDQYDPVQESSGSTNWSMVSAGYGYTCGVKTDGTAWCWGDSNGGALGDGQNETDQVNPVQVSDDGPWSSIDAANKHTCGVKTDGTGWCWGDKRHGILGIGSDMFPTESQGVGVNCGFGAEAISEGQITYNTDVKAIQYCAGSGMVKVGK